MKFRGLMLLFAGLIAAPPAAMSATGWGAPTPGVERYAFTDRQAADRYRFRPYEPSRSTPPISRQHDWSMSPQVSGYRFRPWERPARPTPMAQRQFVEKPVPTYWRGVPTPVRPGFGHPVDAAGMPYDYRFGPGQRPQDRLAYAQPRRGYAELPPAVAASQGYRFRPLPPPARQARSESPVRYRPLQMQIPNRYVFRPLHPVRPTAPMARPVQYPGYAYASYPLAGAPAGSYGAVPARPWAYPGHFRPYPPAPANYAPLAYQRPPAPMPYGTAYSPALVRNTAPIPRFRPLPQPGREATRLRYGSRHAQVQRRYAWRRPPALMPPQAGRYRPPMTAYSGFGAPRPAMSRPPVAATPHNPYGTDWYDGRGDGEGAWYRLVVESAPAVSQAWKPLPSIGGASAN